MIRLSRLPGVPAIEAALLLNRSARVKSDPDLDRRADEVGVRIFGISEHQTEFQYPDWYYHDDEVERDEEKLEILYNAEREWRAHFDVLWTANSDPITVWNGLGWDVRADDGHPLHCLPYFQRRMLCSCRSIAGAKSMLEIEASVWRDVKDQSAPSPARAKLNQSFLSLGSSRRRTREIRQ